MADETRAATLHDVAREAGVSLATASRALNGSTRKVADAYRERVLAAAHRLNYTPNLAAQAVVRGRTRSIGLVVSDIEDPYFSSIAAGVFRAAERAGLVVTIAVSDRRPERQIELVGALRSQRPQALLLVGSRVADPAIDARLESELRGFQAEGGRVALVSQEGLPFDTVVPENREGARLLAERLLELGYRRFALLTGPAGLLTAADRTAGYREALAAGGVDLPEELVVHAEFSRDGGYAAAGELLRRGLDLDVVLTGNDVMAVGAMARFREHGMALPGDLAIAGFDDIATLRDVTPALTTLHLPLARLGEAAVELALGDPEPEPRAVRIGGHVVVRQSTPPRG
ncbi:LacI family DNA-binding transcriptional regulator [Pseudolysinimonas sp.]|uniref:LacI family DNA-binding transcriptional regulator n=1 Tax=Pseudolysinimonas sp. TaxID=2680009 RepID=UPI003F81CEC9